jgi:hypothetical protein
MSFEYSIDLQIQSYLVYKIRLGLMAGLTLKQIYQKWQISK